MAVSTGHRLTPGTPTSAREATAALALRFVTALIAVLRWRLALAVAVSLVLAFAEGAGLLLLVPLLDSIGLTASDGSSSRLASLTTRVFAAVGTTPSLGSVLAVFVVVSLVHASAHRASALLSPLLAHRFATTLRRRLYAAIVAARWSYIAEQRTSDLAHGVTVEADRAGTAAYQFMTLLGGLAVSSIYIAVAARLSPGMTAIVAAGGVLFLVTLGGRTRQSEDRAEVYTDASRRLFGMTSQSLGGLKVAKSVGAEARDVALFNSLDIQLADAYHGLLRSFANTRVRMDLISALSVSALLLLAVELFHLRGTGLLLLTFVFARIIPRIRSLQESAQLMVAGLPSFRSIETTIGECERVSEPADAGGQRLRLARELRVETVSYRYASADTNALDNVSLSVPAGRTTAIVGPSGSGKSTLADLLMGLMPAASGRIAVDERTLDVTTLRQWRRSVGYVPQDSFLLHDTIRANLLWAVPDARQEDMWEALDQAAARSFVEAHPRGLDAVVGDRGLRLSGGERQRLALARALLARPDVLLLDEATSALDSINEQQILGSLARLHGRLTIVVITHRLSTIREADLVYVLERGRLVESGEWGDLAARSGPFRALLDAQRLEATPLKH
jgi:ATP-binding cassette, subfamily C, bacterial